MNWARHQKWRNHCDSNSNMQIGIHYLFLASYKPVVSHSNCISREMTCQVKYPRGACVNLANEFNIAGDETMINCFRVIIILNASFMHWKDEPSITSIFVRSGRVFLTHPIIYLYALLRLSYVVNDVASQ